MEFDSATLDINMNEKDWEEILNDAICAIIREWNLEIDEEIDEGYIDLNKQLMGLAKFAFRELINEDTITIYIDKEKDLTKWDFVLYESIKEAFDSWIDDRLDKHTRPSDYTDEQWKTEYLEERYSLLDGCCIIINIDKDCFLYVGDDNTPIKEL